MSNQEPWYKKHKYLLISILVLVVVAVAVAIYNAKSDDTQTTAQKVAAIDSSQYNPTDNSARDSLDKSRVNLARLKAFVQKNQTSTVDTASLDSQINTIISSNQDIIFGVSIKYLNNGQTQNYGNTGAMTAASVTKVLTAADYYKQVELGNKSLSTVMANGQTAQYNIEQMIVVSDNDAWHILNDSLTYPQMQDYAESIGLTSYDYTNNKISAVDVTKLLGDLYERKLINETNSEELLSYMERANYRDLIIPAVPETDTVYHKAGEYSGNLHDAAIITNTNQAIVLTIFTKSTQSYSKSRIASLMQQITTPTLAAFHLN